MKKSLAIILIMCACISAKAQFSANSPTQYLQIDNLPNIDAVFLFNGISNEAEISYTGFGSTEWREYNNSFVSNQPYFSPDNATGYILLIDGVPTYYIYVIDYSLYPITLNSLQISPNQPNECVTLFLDTSASAPDLVYYDKNNQRQTLTRTFSLSYVDYAFSGEEWQDSAAVKDIDYPFSQIEVSAPRQDVTFALSGDSFAREMNLPLDSFTVDYTAIRVETHPKGTITEREGKNENERKGGTEKALSGSGWLNVYLESRANKPTAVFYEWHIYNTAQPKSYYRFSDENLRYTFKDGSYENNGYIAGNYVARLTATSAGGCVSVVDSVTIKVEPYSGIDIPNAFSPNGDNKNDEFKIAWKSVKLDSYKCVIYNRWGRVVYKGTGETALMNGWDGKINGKYAASGTYYYFIELSPAAPASNGKYKVEKYHGTVNLFGGSTK
ncbi:MAG: gliding motility-associated C-terminal domain-containing protein [Prevotellaceae bacterium]|jgi:gliding motility-associated-like protein|nr:gliding motility-associated C-terminal domain-containing protein [Prevotellaceae bacterium]